MTDLFLKMFNMSMSATWIVLAIILLRLFTKKAPKWLNVCFWSLAGLRLVLPFSFKSILSLVPSGNTIPNEITETATPYIESGFEFVDKAVNPVISDVLAPNVTEVITPMDYFVNAAVIIWIVGVILMFLYSFVSYLSVYRIVKGSKLEKENIYRCQKINSPFIMGVIKPKIYLPEFLNAEESSYVIAHEKSHIKRLDFLWKPLAFTILSVYWYNPLLWVAYVLLCRDIEYACDAKVIKEKGEEYKVPYSKVLIECSIPRKAVTACPVAFGEVGIKSRIKNILSYKKPSFWIVSISLVLCIAVAVCFLTDPLSNGNGADFITKKEKTAQNLEDEVVTSSVTTTKDGNTASNTDGSVNKVTSAVITEENKSFLNENDNFGDLDLELVKKIKQDYFETFKSSLEYESQNKKRTEKDIYIQKYFGTFSDGSIIINIAPNYNRYSYQISGDNDISSDSLKTVVLGKYVYKDILSNNYSYLIVYKNSKFEPLKSAYEKEMISEKILAEFFSKYPELDLSDEYFTENDDISVLNKETIVLIKNMYLGHIRRNTKNESYKDLTVSDIYIKKYYKEFGNNYFGVIIGLNVKTKNKITEEVGNYTYIHREYEGLLLRHKTKSTVYHDLSDSYILKIINDKDLELFFKDYPEYKGK